MNRSVPRKAFCVLLALFLLIHTAAFSESQGSAEPPEDGFEPSSGMSALGGDNFSMDDIPSEYLEPCDRQGCVETVRYPFDPENGTQYNAATFIFLMAMTHPANSTTCCISSTRPTDHPGNICIRTRERRSRICWII